MAVLLMGSCEHPPTERDAGRLVSLASLGRRDADRGHATARRPASTSLSVSWLWWGSGVATSAAPAFPPSPPLLHPRCLSQRRLEVKHNSLFPKPDYLSTAVPSRLGQDGRIRDRFSMSSAHTFSSGRLENRGPLTGLAGAGRPTCEMAKMYSQSSECGMSVGWRKCIFAHC